MPENKKARARNKSPVVSTLTVNKVLPRHGFALKKGDAKRVAETTTDPSDGAIITAAIQLGIRRCERIPKPPSQPMQNPSPQAPPPPPFTPEEEIRYRPAVEWIAARAAKALEDPLVLDGIVRCLIDEAVDGTRDAKTRSYFERDAKVPHDLSKWKTLGEFMQEPSDTRDSWGNRMTISGAWRNDFRGEVMDALRSSAWEAKDPDIAPPEIVNLVSGLGDDELYNLAIDDAYEALTPLDREECWLEQQVEAVPFQDALWIHRSDAMARLNSDIAAAEQRRLAGQQADARLERASTELQARFSDRRIDKESVYEVANAIAEYIRDPQGIELAQRLFGHGRILSLFDKKAKQAFSGMCSDWIDEIWDEIDEEYLVDFEHPLAKLFVALDDAWRKEGREWRVDVTEGTDTFNFGPDNWLLFLSYALKGGSGLHNHWQVVVRRIEVPADPKKSAPQETIGALRIDGKRVRLLSVSETKTAHESVHETILPVEPRPSASYLTLEDLCPAFAASVSPRIRHTKPSPA